MTLAWRSQNDSPKRKRGKALPSLAPRATIGRIIPAVGNKGTFGCFIFAMALVLAFFFVETATKAQEAASDQDSNTVVVPRIGMEGFRYLLHRNGLQPLQSIKGACEEPSKTVIVLLGPMSINKFLAHDSLIKAVEQGASILIASDCTADYCDVFGVKITGEIVHALNTEDCYLGLEKYPFVRPMKDRSPANDSPHWIFETFDKRGENAVATNFASVMQLVPSRTDHDKGEFRQDYLATYPAASLMIRENERIDRLFEVTHDLFAVGGKFGSGRFLALADHSVFLNWMMLAEKHRNGNLEFTERCISWLRGSEGENPKDRCLFVEEGAIKTTFDLPVSEPDLWPLILRALMVLEKHGDELVGEMEQRDAFNSTAQSMFGRRAIARFALIGATGVLLFLGFRRLMQARVAPDLARTLVTPELAAMIPRGNILQQRFDGLLGLANVYDAARDMIREFMAGIDAEPDEHGHPPPLEIAVGQKDSAGLRRRIMHLWQIGFGSRPMRIKPEEWRNLTEDLKEVLENADVGGWRFVRSMRFL